MPEQELQVHPEVDEDVIEISTHIAMHNPLAAEAVEFAITRMYELLAQEPLMGTEYHPLRRSLTGIRMITVPEYPNYLIYYRPLPENAGARILYVLHGARDAAAFAKEHHRQ
ncbi:type II toxin-antitoxin system RelE/ParE family toxin [Prosthecobacter sp.]|uniref:type II toxin-antitoxin system RelE/ParE family toxin n=1 Tax=Prosthecobacter sp. TaxID=1965333 RepID=UPI002487A50E|nr:type II toxin-antitoxin system RelE/ParE family toxin [Prosthecobacter sp.]MDI1314600.1 type II toxin-antitoxin system RelE/ParE family toxin [Prosthecobacter sp.]